MEQKKYSQKTYKTGELKVENEITIYEIIDELKKQYERAKKKSFIAKPLSYALYSVWKATDMVEKRRELPHKEG